MLRTFLLEPASSRGPYDDKPTVTQGGVVYNLTHDEKKEGTFCFLKKIHPLRNHFAARGGPAPYSPSGCSRQLDTSSDPA